MIILLKKKIKTTLLYTFVKEAWIRFFYICLSFFFTFLSVFLHSVEFFYIIICPVLNENKKFIFIDVTEAFFTTFKICFILSFFFILPFLFYQIWCFFVSGYYVRERRWFKFYLFIININFYFCSLLFYFLLLPDLCEFLIHFEITTPTMNLELEARFYTYLTLFFRFAFITQLLSHTPLLVFLMIQYKILSAKKLVVYRPWFGLFFVLVGAFISPPTGFSQILFFLNAILSYEFFVFFSICLKKLKSKQLFF